MTEKCDHGVISQKKNHDLFDFMMQISQEMSDEYNRIQKRATEDPGTAGDQGEENWAKILRDWLPRNYKVVTKGRIISLEGITSPQIDILVLKGVYPRKLLDKKLYLAAGVVAAFECKTTLKASHIEDAVKTSVKIKNMCPKRTGTPYEELHAPIVYGLLAHSHSWKGDKSTPEKNIDNKLREQDMLYVSHPREQIDLICVSDLATWSLYKSTFDGPKIWKKYGWPDKLWNQTRAKSHGPNGSADSAYMMYSKLIEDQVEQFTPIGALISGLSGKIAWEDSSLQDLAIYYRLTNLKGRGHGSMRMWPSTIYSEKIRSMVEEGKRPFELKLFWDKWGVSF